MYDNGPYGLHIVGLAASALGTLVLVIVAIGLIVLLVRFLLVATTAAKLYVAKNSPAQPTTAPVAAAPAPAAATTKPTTTTKPRTPKAPPAS
ncbi:MAG: hypothetical protein KF761_05225 [Salinibacterium sp.]|nr:hypothetical protein [Salinibacterium sp.]